MKLSSSDIKFIKDNIKGDVTKLLLSASKYPDLDIPFLVEQIQSRKQIKEKLPSWYDNDAVVFPAKIAAEQCSSEHTAAYKQRFVSKGYVTCDLTGGLGVDSFFISRVADKHDYIERFDKYCEAARNNFEALGVDNVRVINGDSSEVLSTSGRYDLIYVDPARRGDADKRVFALKDCEPNLPSILPSLWSKTDKILAKLSPMADISMTLDLLPDTVEIHILSVKNECKELLFYMEKGGVKTNPKVVCVNFTADGEEKLSFDLNEEKDSTVSYAEVVDKYLYEPNASVMKAGAFKLVSLRFGLKKLHTSSHLYTGDKLVEDFPGRKFSVEDVIPFSSKRIKTLCKDIPKANITVRNFPMKAEEVRKKLKMADGGDIYLFATTLSSGERVIVKCVKAV
jgi:hypothetical protein